MSMRMAMQRPILSTSVARTKRTSSPNGEIGGSMTLRRLWRRRRLIRASSSSLLAMIYLNFFSINLPFHGYRSREQERRFRSLPFADGPGCQLSLIDGPNSNNTILDDKMTWTVADALDCKVVGCLPLLL